MTAILDLEGTTYFAGSKVERMHLNEQSLTALTGEYRNSELDAAYVVSLEQGSLMLRNGSNPPVKLDPVAKDEFDAADSFTVVFDRSKDDRISGLTYSLTLLGEFTSPGQTKRDGPKQSFRCAA